MSKLIFVSHCVLNTLSKVENQKKAKMSGEDSLRKTFLQKALEMDIQLIQLPCPEFTLYGSKRWGHCKDQFNNPFFKAHCRTILAPFLTQMQEYCDNPRFHVLGIVGIEGSPSCGVTQTYRGSWGGEFSGHENINAVLSTIHKEQDSGVFIDVLQEMLKEANLFLPIVPLSHQQPSLCLDLLEKEQ